MKGEGKKFVPNGPVDQEIKQAVNKERKRGFLLKGGYEKVWLELGSVLMVAVYQKQLRLSSTARGSTIAGLVPLLICGSFAKILQTYQSKFMGAQDE
ncbi:hypothetical protein VNO77_02069 [Canavalia gladiata]|uniref:Uncharacterized protein n=1 Tax=Canavalia gladiata TaxID=3824 RepID=A0AAN9RAX8_CANGL